MMWQYFLLGLALMFVLEGIMPFIMPERYKQIMRKMSEQPERVLRIMGFILMIIGVGLLFVVKQLFGI